MVSQQSDVVIKLDYLHEIVTPLKKKILRIFIVVEVHFYDIDKILNTLVKEGVKRFAVSSFDEDIKIRKLYSDDIQKIFLQTFTPESDMLLI